MANDLTQNPWILDTASNTTPQWYDLLSPGRWGTKPVFVKRMVWRPSGNGQTLLVGSVDAKNHAANTVWSITSTGEVGEEHVFDTPITMQGFWLYTMTAGGTLYVYL